MSSTHQKRLVDHLDDLRNMAADPNAAYTVTEKLYDTLCSVESVVIATAVTSLLTTILKTALKTEGDTLAMAALRKRVRNAIDPLLKQMLKAYDADIITRLILHLLSGLQTTKKCLKQLQEKNELIYVEITMQRLNQCLKLTTMQHV